MVGWRAKKLQFFPHFCETLSFTYYGYIFIIFLWDYSFIFWSFFLIAMRFFSIFFYRYAILFIFLIAKLPNYSYKVTFGKIAESKIKPDDVSPRIIRTSWNPVSSSLNFRSIKKYATWSIRVTLTWQLNLRRLWNIWRFLIWSSVYVIVVIATWYFSQTFVFIHASRIRMLPALTIQGM